LQATLELRKSPVQALVKCLLDAKMKDAKASVALYSVSSAEPSVVH
jgi:hypothetical protein